MLIPNLAFYLYGTYIHMNILRQNLDIFRNMQHSKKGKILIESYRNKLWPVSTALCRG